MAAKTAAKRVPLRTCVACGARTAKGSLVRIVAPRQGAVEVDVTGKAHGRGAYLCRCGDTHHDLRGRGRLGHALHKPLSDNEWNNLVSSIEAARQAEQS
jgi:predicted RNA-binding protein YlxR (DUF448 family)